MKLVFELCLFGLGSFVILGCLLMAVSPCLQEGLAGLRVLPLGGLCSPPVVELFTNIVKRLLVVRRRLGGDFQSPAKLVDVLLKFFLFDRVGVRYMCGADFASEAVKAVPVSYMARRDGDLFELTPGSVQKTWWKMDVHFLREKIPGWGFFVCRPVVSAWSLNTWLD